MEMALRTSNLSLPQGFVEMDREEMMYVDGGGISINLFANIFDYALIGISIVSGIIGTMGAIKMYKVFSKKAAKRLAYTATETIKKMLLSNAFQAVFGFTISLTGAVCEVLANVLLGGSLGYAVGYAIDIMDGKKNGIVFG